MNHLTTGVREDQGEHDARLIRDAQRGDEAAWTKLFERHHARIVRFFQARLASREQAEDLASNVFLEAFRSIRRFEWQGRPFEAWLYGIARHELATYYRRRRADVVTDLSTEAAARDEFAPVEIRDVLDALPEEYRLALELRYLVGLSGQEAAGLVGRTHGAFRSLLFRASRAFREELLQDVVTDLPHAPRRRLVADPTTGLGMVAAR